MGFRPLPIGIDSFREIIEQGYYYIDKTAFIKELLDMKEKVNLFTRPRRFGKTLNLSMLQCFFEALRCQAAVCRAFYYGTERAVFKTHVKLSGDQPFTEIPETA